jgi:DNA polymerase I-like protein with 3'-5' exonuclease and polymerase domains
MEKQMTQVAIIESKMSRTNWSDRFDDAFEFDRYALCSDSSKKKILKADVDIEIDVDTYDWVILVGSESLKFFTSINSITEYSGRCVEDKFLPVINPAMLSFKPEAKPLWDKSKTNIIDFISGDLVVKKVSEEQALGIDTEDEALKFLQEALEHENKYIALDSETTGLYPRDGYMLGFSMSYKKHQGAYIITDVITEQMENIMQEIFNTKIVVFHNAKFDLAFFEYHFNFKFPKFEDTMLLHYCLDEVPGGHGLKQLAMEHTDYGDYEKPMHDWIDNYKRQNRILKADFQWGSIPFEVMKTYAAMDAVVTLLVFEKLYPAVRKNAKLFSVYENILIPGCRMLTDIQDNGVPFDKLRLLKGRDLMQTDIDNAVAELYEFEAVQEFEEAKKKEFNPNSTVQLRELLFDFVGLKPTGKKTGTGQHSTDAEVLKQLAEEHEIPKHILSIRQKSKIKNTYLDKIYPQLDKDSRLRTGFNLHGTTSGRLSSSGKMNMQQIPRDNPIVKGCIRAKEGNKIVAMDLTTAEVYVAAVLADDKNLMEVFKTGGNFHSSIAKLVFSLPCEADEVVDLYPTQRQAAKAVTFGIMYGAGASKISQQVTTDSGKPFSKQDAQEVIDDYFRQFHKLKKWIDLSSKFIMDNGFIYGATGRKRRLPNVKSDNQGIQSHEVRSGLNFLVQSVASDINLLGAVDMNEYVKSNNMKSKIFALVHDSILAEVPEDEIDLYSEKLQEFIQKDRGFSIPGTPVGCDFDVHDDYSLGKFTKMYDL